MVHDKWCIPTVTVLVVGQLHEATVDGAQDTITPAEDDALLGLFVHFEVLQTVSADFSLLHFLLDLTPSIMLKTDFLSYYPKFINFFLLFLTLRKSFKASFKKVKK